MNEKKLDSKINPIYKSEIEIKLKCVLHFCFTLKKKNPLNFLFFSLLRGL